MQNPSESSFSGEKVTLMIKNPANLTTSFKVERPLDSNVLSLKQQLQTICPNNPTPQQQKLIFAGRLLTDDSIMRDILRLHDKSTVQTFHLIVNQQSQSPPPPPPQPQQPPPQQPQPQQQFQQFPGFYQHMGVGVGVGVGAAGMPPMYGGNYPFPPPPHLNAPFPQYMGIPRGNQNIPPNQAQANNPIGRAPNAGEQGRNPALALKLIFFVLLMSQAGGGPAHLIFLILGAILFYCYHTGRLRVVHWAYQVGPQPQQPNQERQVPPPINPLHNTLVRNQASYNNGSGLLHEIEYFVLPFFLSLFPTWHPDRPQQPQ